MAKVIWKKQLKPGAHFYDLPRGAAILTVAFQHGQACMWFMCNPAEPNELRAILLTPTGEQFGGFDDYIGTMMTEDKTFVFHVLEARR